jgi:hypothetical protein
MLNLEFKTEWVSSTTRNLTSWVKLTLLLFLMLIAYKSIHSKQFIGLKIKFIDFDQRK